LEVAIAKLPYISLKHHIKMKEQEGVIKYQLQHEQKLINAEFSLSEINAWRTVIFRLGLIGQDPERYDGLGFGNISQRLNSQGSQFIISGTQAGSIEHLSPENYCLVVKADPRKNRLESCGLCNP
jgi:L-ribulose-5-phosphate 4-epimerase